MDPAPKPRLVWRTQWLIFLAFFRVGILGFGGGPSSIPLVHQETVKNYKWMDEEQFADTLAIANTMPGPIATKMAGYIGYRVGGVIGCLNGLFATVMPTALMMIFLLQLLQQYKDIPWVQHMSASVVPVVAVMLATMTWDFVKKSGETLGWVKGVWLILASLLVTEVFNIHPAIVILVLILYVLLPFGKGKVS
ncbi:chromate transporter [Mesobacillus campisalis]|uniref:Chromate transporter n=1 Tax=Mesobacillus campisalis TaxID=1408103 RepID=A0A0M2SX40_9BACI|nr:chromate transporter [Mesobacillus campisalis]KKK37537.1 chromate transporter [Mesobacillus campisalis]